MIASMSTIRGKREALAETARMAGEAMQSWLAEFDGYRGLLLLAAEAEGTVHAITFWESEQAAERSSQARMRMRDTMSAQAGLTVEGTEIYVVAFCDCISPAPDPALRPLESP